MSFKLASIYGDATLMDPTSFSQMVKIDAKGQKKVEYDIVKSC